MSGIGILMGFAADIELLYYALFWSLNIVALNVHPFFLTFHLSIIIIRSSVIQNLLGAIFGILGKIILTLVIALIVIYWFTIWSFSGDLANYYPNSTCNSLLKCFLVTFDQTFKNNGGVGPYTDQTSKAYDNTSSK